MVKTPRKKEQLVLWPQPTTEALRLAEKTLDQLAPGWRVKMGEANMGPTEFVDLLWEWNPLFEGIAEAAPDSVHIDEADAALERLAQGGVRVFAALSPGARGVLKSRHLNSLSGAITRMLEGDLEPVLRLPHGLSRDQRRLIATITFFYAAPLGNR
ncbi:MAG: hypothetical protein JWP35_4207 [Caulobacter sp.]|nr:hypothetical protein [Caulobacter sp.]